jgi:hypothetical protein
MVFVNVINIGMDQLVKIKHVSKNVITEENVLQTEHVYAILVMME